MTQALTYVDVQCETYTRLARESIAAEEAVDGKGLDLDNLVMDDTGEDKIFAAMGVAKTITTVRLRLFGIVQLLQPRYRL